MATLNVSLTDELEVFVKSQSAERGYESSSEYVKDLILREQRRTELRTLLVDGMGSGPGSELDAEYFERMCPDVRSADIS